MVKLEVKIRITSEEFLKLAARYLPFEIISAGEIVENPPKMPIEAISKAVQHITKRAIAKQRSRKSAINLNRGMNKVVIEALTGGKMRTHDLREALVANGFANNSITSHLQRLTKYGIIRSRDKGIWELVNVPNAKETDGAENSSDRRNMPQSS
jgi:hypothetical protein